MSAKGGRFMRSRSESVCVRQRVPVAVGPCQAKPSSWSAATPFRRANRPAGQLPLASCHSPTAFAAARLFLACTTCQRMSAAQACCKEAVAIGLLPSAHHGRHMLHGPAAGATWDQPAGGSSACCTACRPWLPLQVRPAQVRHTHVVGRQAGRRRAGWAKVDHRQCLLVSLELLALHVYRAVQSK